MQTNFARDKISFNLKIETIHVIFLLIVFLKTLTIPLTYGIYV